MLIFCLSLVLLIYLVDQLSFEDLKFDTMNGTVRRPAPETPPGGTYKLAENHLWLDYYDNVIDSGSVGNKEWRAMQAVFAENGFNRTIDSLRQHVIILFLFICHII